MVNFYAYMRISTQEERGKQQYSRQERSLERYAEQHKIDFVLTLKEDVSGKSFDGRKEWQRLEKIVREGDTIVFKDLARFTREAENGYNKYMELMGRGISLVFLDNPTVCTDYVQGMMSIAEKQDLVTKTVMQSMVKILLIAELDRYEKERLMISRRTRDGMRARKEQAEAQGKEWHAGRKPGTLDKMTPELRDDIYGYLMNDSIKLADILTKHPISRNTLKKYISILTVEE